MEKKQRAWLRRLCVIVLAVVVAIGCHRRVEKATTFRAEEAASGDLRSIASAAMSKARHWRSDAILVRLEARGANAQAQKIFDFYSPGDRSGYRVTIGGAGAHDEAMSPANWSTVAIPSDFPDWPAAESVARERGLVGGVGGATLTAVKLCGLISIMRWQVMPADANQPRLKSYNVYFYANPASGEPPLDWHEAGDLADASLKGDNLAWHSLMQAAQAGDPNALTNIGYLYAVGAPMAPKSYSQAGPYFCVAAFEGSPAAQFDLGLLYRNGWGVGTQSMETAGILYRLAAEQGLPDAQLSFGTQVWRAQATSNADAARELASQWWQKAAAQGLDAGRKNVAAIRSWDARKSSAAAVWLFESTALMKARNWNPQRKGLIPNVYAGYPDRLTPDGWPQN